MFGWALETFTSMSRRSSTISTSRRAVQLLDDRRECEVQPGLIFELIQPLEGDSIYRSTGQVRRRRAAHCPHESQPGRVGCFQEAFRRGWVRDVDGRPIGETIEFYYLDTAKDAHSWPSPAAHAIELTPVRQYPPAAK